MNSQLGRIFSLFRPFCKTGVRCGPPERLPHAMTAAIYLIAITLHLPLAIWSQETQPPALPAAARVWQAAKRPLLR
jgi:hypothetical protein